LISDVVKNWCKDITAKFKPPKKNLVKTATNALNPFTGKALNFQGVVRFDCIQEL
jgi:hypothetical protein